MKIALELGESLDVVLMNKDEVVGTLSLQIRGLAQAVAQPKALAAKTVSSETRSAAPAKKKRTMSAEVRERLRQAQLRRWARVKGAQQQEGEQASSGGEGAPAQQ